MSTFWDSKTARVLCTALIFATVLAFLSSARETLTLFLFAVLFSYLLEPFVELAARLLHGRGRGIVATYVLLGALGTAFGFLFGPRIGEEFKDLLTSMPSLIERMASGQFVAGLVHRQGWTNERAEQIQNFFLSHRAAILTYGEGLAQRLEAPLSHIWWLILIPILAVFFLKDGPSMAAGAVNMTGERQRRVLAGVFTDVNVMLGSYIRAQLILAALTAVVLTVALGLTHVPFIFVLGPIAGLCEFLPVVGPAIACCAIFGIALLSGYGHMLWIFLFLGTWRTMQDYVNAPRIMGRSLEVSPLAEIFAVLAGGEIGGMVGALVAVPVLATLRILWLRLRERTPADQPMLVTQELERKEAEEQEAVESLS